MTLTGYHRYRLDKGGAMHVVLAALCAVLFSLLHSDRMNGGNAQTAYNPRRISIFTGFSAVISKITSTSTHL